MYKFKYHPNNTILRFSNEIFLEETYLDFTITNPSFPIIEFEYFEYTLTGQFHTIVDGLHTIQNPLEYETIINAINNLPDLIGE